MCMRPWMRRVSLSGLRIAASGRGVRPLATATALGRGEPALPPAAANRSGAVLLLRRRLGAVALRRRRERHGLRLGGGRGGAGFARAGMAARCGLAFAVIAARWCLAQPMRPIGGPLLGGRRGRAMALLDGGFGLALAGPGSTA